MIEPESIDKTFQTILSDLAGHLQEKIELDI